MTTKRCTQCKKRLDVTKFYTQWQKGRNGQRYKYPHSMCKACRRSYMKERSRSIKNQCIEYKGGKCNICGVVGDPVIYDFHHRDRKSKNFNIGWSGGKLFKDMKEELDKCDLICANCHRKITFGIMKP